MKRTVLSVVALSGALVLGACGSDAAPTGAKASTSASPSAAAEASGAKVGDVVALSDLAEKSSAAVKEKGTAHMTMTAPGAGEIEADVDFSGASPKMSMSVAQEGESVDMVYVDKVMYMGGESFTELTGGKKWIKIDPDGDDMMSKMMGPLLGQMESSMGNPAEQLKAYGDADAKVTAVKDGITTYEVTLTKAQLSKAMKSQEEALPGLSEEALKQIPDEGMTYSMSVDETYLPTTLEMELSGQAIDMEYSKWGEPVDITAPKASDVGTFEIPTS